MCGLSPESGGISAMRRLPSIRSRVPRTLKSRVPGTPRPRNPPRNVPEFTVCKSDGLLARQRSVQVCEKTFESTKGLFKVVNGFPNLGSMLYEVLRWGVVVEDVNVRR